MLAAGSDAFLHGVTDVELGALDSASDQEASK